MENLDYLLKELMLEDPKFSNFPIPEDPKLKLRLYNLLLTIRAPKTVDKEFVEKQNLFIKEINNKKTVFSCNDLDDFNNIKRFSVWNGDITCIDVDVLINFGDECLLGCFDPKHSCHTKDIFINSSVLLRNECNDILKGSIIPIGESIITDSYNLPCKKIIHTVFPIVFNNILDIHKKMAVEAINNSLILAKENKFKTVAFSLPNLEDFNFLYNELLLIFIESIKKFLKHDKFFDRIVLVLDSDDLVKIANECIKK